MSIITNKLKIMFPFLETIFIFVLPPKFLVYAIF